MTAITPAKLKRIAILIEEYNAAVDVANRFMSISKPVDTLNLNIPFCRSLTGYSPLIREMEALIKEAIHADDAANNLAFRAANRIKSRLIEELDNTYMTTAELKLHELKLPNHDTDT